MGSSREIRARQTREIKRAARHAWRAGRDLTRFVVINFPLPEEGNELAAQRQFRAIRNMCRSWWDYLRAKKTVNGPLTDVRTWENKNGILHVNWMVHIPEDLAAEFTIKLDLWIGKVLADGKPEASKNQSIYNLNGLLNYILKGTEKTKAGRFGIEPIDQGVIWGRRAVASMNLGRSARNRDWQAGTLSVTEWAYTRPSQYADTGNVEP